MQIRLRKEQILTVRGDCRGIRIQCEAGILWLTQAGDRRDHLLPARQAYVAHRPGRLVIEARRDALLTVSAPQSGQQTGLGPWLLRWLRGLRRPALLLGER